MKREIKFRVFDLTDSVMMESNDKDVKIEFYDGKMKVHYVDEVNTVINDFVQDVPRVVECTDFEVMQSTELKDKNGKQIYEGDILKSPDTMSYRFGELGVVQYMEDYGGFGVVGKWSKNQHHEMLSCDVAIDSEIVGNEYENSELIKTENEN